MAKYRYRFVELEEFPEYDKEKYPFAVLIGRYNPRTNTSYSDYELWLLSHEPIVNADGELHIRGGLFSRYEKTLYETAWNASRNYQDVDFGDEEGSWRTAIETIWTNFDFMDSKGKVYSKAVEPIPVYE